MFRREDSELLRRLRDELYADVPQLTIYTGLLESITSISKSRVKVNKEIVKVLGVWLATDTELLGDNYYIDSRSHNFSDREIILDKELPMENTDVVVAYYSRCATCGYDPIIRRGRNSNCIECGGVGMVLEDGNAIMIPCRKVSGSSLIELQTKLGLDYGGRLIFWIKGEHEGLFRACKRALWSGREIDVPSQFPERIQIDRKYDITGAIGAVRIITQYKDKEA